MASARRYPHPMIVEGRERIVTNAFRSGPDAPIHSYELRSFPGRPAYLTKLGESWVLEEPGQYPRRVSMEAR